MPNTVAYCIQNGLVQSLISSAAVCLLLNALMIPTKTGDQPLTSCPVLIAIVSRHQLCRTPDIGNREKRECFAFLPNIQKVVFSVRSSYTMCYAPPKAKANVVLSSSMNVNGRKRNYPTVGTLQGGFTRIKTALRFPGPVR